MVNKTLKQRYDERFTLEKERRAAQGRKAGLARRGRKKPTQAEKDEIAAYLARNPEPFRG